MAGEPGTIDGRQGDLFIWQDGERGWRLSLRLPDGKVMACMDTFPDQAAAERQAGLEAEALRRRFGVRLTRHYHDPRS